MVSDGEQVSGDVLREGQLGLQGCFRASREADALRHTEDMRIDRHHLPIPEHCPQYIGRLAPYARQSLQLHQIVGHFAAELLAEHAGSRSEVLGFVVGVGDGADVGENLLGRDGRHRLGRGEGLEECRGGHIDPLVGALCRQHDRHQQLPRILEMQFALGRRHLLLKVGDDALVSLFGSHCGL